LTGDRLLRVLTWLTILGWWQLQGLKSGLLVDLAESAHPIVGVVCFVAYVRTVKMSLEATAVQIVWSSRRGSRSIEHLGSARDEAALAALKVAAAERLATRRCWNSG
jgi:hypothetical protein